MTRVLGLLAVLLLALSACSTDTSLSDARAAELISKGMMEGNDASDPFTVSQDQADCVGRMMVDQMGVSHLIDLGLLTRSKSQADSDLTLATTDAEKIAGVYQECADLYSILRKAVKDKIADKKGRAWVKQCVLTSLTKPIAFRIMVNQFDHLTTGTDQWERRTRICVRAH